MKDCVHTMNVERSDIKPDQRLGELFYTLVDDRKVEGSRKVIASCDPDCCCVPGSSQTGVSCLPALQYADQSLPGHLTSLEACHMTTCKHEEVN